MERDVRYLTRDPVFERLERQMDDLVERLMRRPAQASYRRVWEPRLDVYETDEEFTAVVEIPDVDPGTVTIEIESNEVAIGGHRAPRAGPGGAEILQLEIPFGDFERRLALPCPVDAERATADYREGMLTVRLPKIRRGPTKVQVQVEPSE